MISPQRHGERGEEFIATDENQMHTDEFKANWINSFLYLICVNLISICGKNEFDFLLCALRVSAVKSAFANLKITGISKQVRFALINLFRRPQKPSPHGPLYRATHFFLMRDDW
jgi:hypothetical protein